jgi:hypothetical protein
LLAQPEVANEVATSLRAVLDRAEFSLERWLTEVWRMVLVDPALFYDDEGNLRPIKDVPLWWLRRSTVCERTEIYLRCQKRRTWRASRPLSCMLKPHGPALGVVIDFGLETFLAAIDQTAEFPNKAPAMRIATLTAGLQCHYASVQHLVQQYHAYGLSRRAGSRNAASCTELTISADKLDALLGHFIGDLGAVLHAGTVVIGERAGLYKALASEPMNAARALYPGHLRWLSPLPDSLTCTPTRLLLLPSEIYSGFSVNYQFDKMRQTR